MNRLANQMEKAIKEAIKIAGGPTALSKKISQEIAAITPEAIVQWRKCPPKRVLFIENLTKVSRHKLRPDIFGAEDAASS